MTSTTTTTGTPTSLTRPVPAAPTGPVGRVIAASLAAGAVAAALTVVAVPGASEATLVGAGLLAFAAGWAMLAWLSARLTTRPQRWAYVPAAVTAASGAVLIAFTPGEPVMTRLAWVWAPAMVGLAVWVAGQTRRNLHGRRGVLIYPVALAMLLAGPGGLYQATTAAPEAAAGPMRGRLVDVGGYRFHLNCTGTGSPPSSCSAASARPRRSGRASARSSPAPRGCAPMTAPGRLERGLAAPRRRRQCRNGPAPAARRCGRDRSVRPGRALQRRRPRPDLRRHVPA